MYQKQLASFFSEARYSCIEASTKSGKTVAGMAWLFEKAITGPGKGANYWWIAPVFGQAKIAYTRLKRGLPDQLRKPNETEMTLSLPNGAVLSFRGSDRPDSLYGEDVHAAVIDEASRCREDAWHAVRSTLTKTQGPVRIIGNVKGRKNWFYKIARLAESGEQGYLYTKITAQDAVEAGVLPAEEIEDAKRALPENVFKELYLAEPSDDGGNPFSIKAITEITGAMSDAPPVVFGVDLAKSVDYTVVVGLDSEGRVCRFDRFQAPWDVTRDRILRTIGTVRTLADSTGVGDPIVEDLQKNGHVEGVKFTSQSKQQMMEGLALAIQQREIRIPAGVIKNELESFEYEYTRTGVRYSAPSGLHDDCVCALALAVMGRRRKTDVWFEAL
jgi:hypothetical protein